MTRLVTSLPALARLAALLSLYSLDLLDLYAKVAWIGPSESFSFGVVRELGFEREPLPKPAFLRENGSGLPTEIGMELLRASGWTSFYEKCSNLYATKGSDNFDVVKATNFKLGAPFAAEQHVAHELILSASLSVDSVVWVSCQLLFFHRRPPLCQENLVTLFPQRYRLTENEVDPNKMAAINSHAEAELLRMLGLLSRSHPLSKVICAQGFESTSGPGHYSPTVFVCGSPNIFESAFVSVFASTFAELHDDLAQLEVDKVNIMGFELLSRQNSRLRFILREKHGELVAIVENQTNFSTFGHLYVVLVFVDVVLLIAHMRATIDTAQMFGWSSLLGFTHASGKGSDSYGNLDWVLLYRSLYRSSSIAGLTIFSALISWLVNFPFALMWCTESKGKAYALVSAVRIWMLVICLLNLLWSAFVRIHEARAYNVVKCAFVSPLEVLAASAIIVTMQTNKLLNVAEVRRQLNGQQGDDNEAFPGRSALSNAYSEEVDGFATTPPQILQMLFAPLVIIVAETLTLVMLVLWVKSVYYRRRLPHQDNDSVSSVSVVDFDNLDEHLTSNAIDLHTSTKPLMPRRRAKLYHRLPLEELLRTPARANSLVRCNVAIDEVEKDGLTYMRPHVYYDFGVVVSQAGFLRTRRGFSTVIHRRLDAERFFAPAGNSSAVSPSPLKRQRIGDGRAAIRARFALNSVPSSMDAIATAQGSPSPPRTRSAFRPISMSRSMRRRKSMEDLLENSSLTF